VIITNVLVEIFVRAHFQLS